MISKAKETLGVFLMLVSGMLVVGQWVQSKLLLDARRPYFLLQVVTYVLVSLWSGGVFLAAKAPWPSRVQMKWNLLRCVFANSTLLATMLAVNLGATTGDVSALLNTQILYAGLAGHFALGERARLPHLLAFAVTIVGALLVSKPESIFGSRGAGGSQLPGLVMAFLAAVCQAAMIICARMTGDVSGSLGAALETGIGIAFFLLVSVINPEPRGIADGPVGALGQLAISFGLSWLSVVFCVLGGQWCTTAVSSTTYSTAKLVAGYAFQVMIFAESPDPTTLLGAGLMLGAVCVLATIPPTSTQSQTQSRSDGGAVKNESLRAPLLNCRQPQQT